MKSEFAIWRDEIERTERRKPWLVFSRPEPVKPEPDFYQWKSVAELFDASRGVTDNLCAAPPSGAVTERGED